MRYAVGELLSEVEALKVRTVVVVVVGRNAIENDIAAAVDCETRDGSDSRLPARSWRFGTTELAIQDAGGW